MQYDVSHLLREPVGCQWEVDVDEVGSVEPVKGERIQGQLRLTRFNQGVWTEARLGAKLAQVCDRCLQNFRQPVSADFVEFFRTGEPISTDLESGELFVDAEDVIDLDEVFRQHLILNLPSKLLCNPQCVGICSHCGGYGDRHNHDCRPRERQSTIDPRWGELEALGVATERDR